MMDTEMNVDIYFEFLRFALTDNSSGCTASPLP